jgi:hypothetical protein
MIRDLITFWEKKLESAAPDEREGLLANMMKERMQFDPDTQKALVELNEKYSSPRE